MERNILWHSQYWDISKDLPMGEYIEENYTKDIIPEVLPRWYDR